MTNHLCITLETDLPPDEIKRSLLAVIANRRLGTLVSVTTTPGPVPDEAWLKDELSAAISQAWDRAGLDLDRAVANVIDVFARIGDPNA